jgi:putative tricarboxylic transport membrane protein
MAGESDKQPAFRSRTAEIVVALAIFAIGALIVVDSLRIGARWGADGPQTGYFPFYVALIVCLASAWNVAAALLAKPEANKPFVERGQLRLVLAVLVPAAVFVGLVGWIGIYVAGALFIGFFMRWLGDYVWWKVAAVSVGVMVIVFLIFERWFLVPLPKGPIERLLGLG